MDPPLMMDPADAEQLKRYLFRHKLIRTEVVNGQRHFQITDHGHDVMTALMYLVESGELASIALAQRMFRTAFRELTQPPMDVNPN
jgi:hypothetical protein